MAWRDLGRLFGCPEPKGADSGRDYLPRAAGRHLRAGDQPPHRDRRPLDLRPPPRVCDRQRLGREFAEDLRLLENLGWHAEEAAKAFAAAYGAKWPKVVAKITNDLDVLLAFYDFPGEGSGSTCAPPTRSSRPSQPSGYGSGSPRDPARGPPGSRWRSNSSSRHSTAGVPSIPPTSSRWSEPARRSRPASSSTDPTNQQAVTLTPHDTLIHRP
jgi:hypothetical protein